MSLYQVTRCICHDRSFKDILEKAEYLDLKSVSALREAGICSTKCKLCEPYLEIALESGRISFAPGEYLEPKETE